MKYRAEIDGLRALAVLPVIFFHAGFQYFGGGFVGVDIFFVISGYLITSIILNELRNTSKFDILNFYERRARRLLPALFLVMLVCIPIAYFTMLPDPLENFGQSLVATSLFANNILLYVTSGYWDLASEYKPLLHTWSLAVEEQYYIVFPLIMIIFWRFGRNILLTLFSILFLLSVLFAHFNFDKDPQGTFFLLPYRGFELLIGVFAAFYLDKRNPKTNINSDNFLSIFGLFLIIISIVIFDEKTPFPSLYTLIPTIGTLLLILYMKDNTILKNFFSLKLLVGIGLISYSAYLWHQPIFSFLRIVSKNEPTFYQLILCIFATFVIAYLAWKYIEIPFRNKQKISRKNLAYSLTAPLILIVFIGINFHQNNGYPARVYADVDFYAEISKNNTNRAFAYKKDEYLDKTKHNILIIGNSFGRDIVNVFLETFNRNNYELAYSENFNDCSVLENIGNNKILDDSDLIIFASGYSSKICIENLLNEVDKDIYFLGTKQFGYNLNWVINVDQKDRSLLKNKILPYALEKEKELMSYVPVENFISLIDGLSTENEIFITDMEGNLISDDRSHLTLSGAKFLGEKIFKNHPLAQQL
tara:strand:- start:1005 stop:2768 length:1764 start_codon:yes stop_codon:yes gene_type:complete